MRQLPLATLLLTTVLVVACASPASTPSGATAAVAKSVAATPITASPVALPSPSPSPSASVAASPSAVAAAAAQPANASLTISTPTNGQSVPAGTVNVSVQYTGPALVAAASAAKLDDLHLHYFLDENATAYIGTLVPVPTGNPHIVHTANLQVPFDNVAVGSHTVVVMLSGANHVSVAPPLSAQVTFTVQ